MEQNFWQRNKTVLIIVGVILLLVLWVVGKYNFFVNQNEAITGAWAQVENQLQRRFDLIPNLQATVKGNTKQEKDVFGMIAEARSNYAGAKSTDAKAKAAGEVESALSRLLVIAEAYPDLKSSEAFRSLMTQLEGTENRIAVERMRYNELVKELNANVKTFPNSILASMFNVKERVYFEVAEEAKLVPKIDFN
jgi:LemA protein